MSISARAAPATQLRRGVGAAPKSVLGTEGVGCEKTGSESAHEDQNAVGWQPNLTSYIGAPTTPTSPGPHPLARGSPGLLVAVALLRQS